MPFADLRLRSSYYDSANPLLAATLLIGDFEDGSDSTFGALARKGVLPLVAQGFVSCSAFGPLVVANA